MNNQTVIGVFDTKKQAQAAKDALTSSNFKSSNIDISQFGQNGTVGDRYTSEKDNVGGFFSNLFGTDEKTSKRYSSVASRGTVVTVYTDSMADAKKAAAILDQYGAIDFDKRATAYENNSFDATKNQNYLNENFSDGKIEVIKENLAVGKREVQTGGVTVKSRIVEKPVVETLRLREEHITIDRKPVDRPATAADFQDETITLTETAEEAVVGKNARVVEEISVGKEATTRTEEIRETVRETEVDIVETAGETVKQYDQTKTGTKAGFTTKK